MANEYLVNTSDLTSVADAIRAKGETSEVLAFPVGFVEAVGAIQAGSGGGVSLPYEGAETPLNTQNIFAALSAGSVKTGEFTLAAPLPNTETLVFSTGLSVVRGILLLCEDFDFDNKPSGNDCVVSNWMFFTDDEQTKPRWSYGANIYSGLFNASGFSFPRVSSVRLESGNLYATASYGGNNNYTPFLAGLKFVWLAWGDE